MIACLHRLFAVFILRGMSLGIAHHLLNFFFVETARGGNFDRLLLTGAEIFGANMGDAVGVDVKSYLDLRHAARRHGNAYEVKLSEKLVTRGHFALPLENPDGDRGLIVLRR